MSSVTGRVGSIIKVFSLRPRSHVSRYYEDEMFSVHTEVSRVFWNLNQCRSSNTVLVLELLENAGIDGGRRRFRIRGFHTSNSACFYRM